MDKTSKRLEALPFSAGGGRPQAGPAPAREPLLPVFSLPFCCTLMRAPPRTKSHLMLCTILYCHRRLQHLLLPSLLLSSPLELYALSSKCARLFYCCCSQDFILAAHALPTAILTVCGSRVGRGGRAGVYIRVEPSGERGANGPRTWYCDLWGLQSLLYM